MGNTQMRFKLSNNINILRSNIKISQEKLASEIGVTRATINAIEKGNYNPSLDLAFRLSRFFKLSIEDIFNIEGEL